MKKVSLPTAEGFFANQVPALLKGGSFKGMDGKVEFSITGEKGGAWLVDFANASVSKSNGTEQVSAIIRAQDLDFVALLEGRMSPSDGLLTQRLHISGDAAYLGRLVGALSGLTAPEQPPA